jgi:hypothetical protein
VDGLRRSPGFASEEGLSTQYLVPSTWHLAFANCQHQTVHPEFADSLPGIPPSDRLRFSRLQLRGSAGIAPASLSSPQGKDAQTEGHFYFHFKERAVLVSEEFTGENQGKSNREALGLVGR